MSRSYKTRQKSIRRIKHELGVKVIPAKAFRFQQEKWRSALNGPFLGTLEDLLARKSL